MVVGRRSTGGSSQEIRYYLPSLAAVRPVHVAACTLYYGFVTHASATIISEQMRMVVRTAALVLCREAK